MIGFKDSRILIIAPHPDDEVFGCGGFISRAKREGAEVYVLYITVGDTQDFSKKGLSTKNERVTEVKEVARFLKLDGFRVALPGNKHHLKLDAVPQKELVHEIERGKNISIEALRPSFVIAPPAGDYNQDHRAAFEATITAARPVHPQFKHLVPTVLTYELPYNSWTSNQITTAPHLFISLTKEDLDTKTKALDLYRSQRKDDNGPLSVYGVKTLACMRGTYCGQEFAEAFSTKRLLW